MALSPLFKGLLGIGIFLIVMWVILNLAFPGHTINIAIGILTGVISGIIVLMIPKGD